MKDSGRTKPGSRKPGPSFLEGPARRGSLVVPGLRFQAFLSPRKEAGGCLVAEAGAGRRSLHVLRRLPGAGDLRDDLLDLACLEHPMCILPRAFFAAPGASARFAVRDFIDGTDILGASRGKSVKEIVSRLSGAAAALAAFHERGFAHGGVKATNFIVEGPGRRRRGGKGSAVVLCDPDFARAPGSGAGHDGRISRPGDLIARDLVQLGEVFYRALAGCSPERRRDGFPVAPSRVAPEVTVDLDRVVLKLLGTGPARGYRSAEEVCVDLSRAQGGQAASGVVAVRALASASRPVQAHRARVLADVPPIVAIRGDGELAAACARRLTFELQLLGSATFAARCFPNAPDPLLPLLELSRQVARCRSGPSELQRRIAVGVDPDPDPASRGQFLKGLADAFLRDTGGTAAALIVESAHHAGRLFVDFLAELVKVAKERESGQARPVTVRPRLVISYRSGSPFQAAIQPLFAAMERSGGFTSVDAGADNADAATAEAGSHGIYESFAAALAPLQLEVLRAAALVGAPIGVELLGSFLDCSRQSFDEALRHLLHDGTLRSVSGEVSFRHGSLQGWIHDSIDPLEKKRLHASIARRLEGALPERVEAIAHHWFGSSQPRRGLRAALDAARSLTRRHEDRRALVYYRRLLELLPARSSGPRRRVAEEAAGVLIRTGEHVEAVRLLGGALSGAKSAAERSRLREKIGQSHHLQGEAEKATVELEASLASLDRLGTRARLDRLRVRCLLADIAISQGRHARAEELLAEPWRGVSRDAPERLATLGNLRLRQFRYAEARELLERSLGCGAGGPATAERSLIWNNLGVLHAQEDRIDDAIRCYREAHAISSSLGQDSMLLTIEANLAVLHSKRGDPESADEACRRALEHDRLWGSARTRFLRLHATGVASLLLGRHAAALESLEAAIELGRELKDSHMLAFDLLYLAECHLHRGAVKAALAAIERTRSIEPSPAPIRPMAEARRALALALRGDRPGEECLRAARMTTGIRYLDAGNRLILGWASRLCADGEARTLLEEARGYFAGAQAHPGEIHAELELAALDLDRGSASGAGGRIRSLERRFTIGSGPLANPMLAARLLVLKASIQLEEKSGLPQVVATLVEAESHMIGRRFRDLEASVRRLRRRIEEASREGQELDAGPAPTHGAAGRPMLLPVEADDSIDGNSTAAARLRAAIRKAAASSAPVLITGETGAGKDVAAKLLHDWSPRAAGPFQSVSCAALPEALLEAELFGHEEGAFSGAASSSPGLLASAQGGSFLFDEIGEMPFGLQAKLLRVLDRGRIRSVGAVEERKLDVRFFFSTSRDLRAAIEEKTFRRDLFYRLSAMELAVPPLRDRLEDLPCLLERFSAELGRPPGALVSAPVLAALQGHAWPGNLRELHNVVARLLLSENDGVSPESIERLIGHPDRRGPLSGPFGAAIENPLLRGRTLAELQDELERQYLYRLHREKGGDVRAMAAALGVTRRAVYKRFRRLGLAPVLGAERTAHDRASNPPSNRDRRP